MNSFIPWIGGKKLLRNAICDRFPNEKINKYVEVFGGAAWVLFNKENHAKTEVYNDINDNLVNLFRCVKYHPKALKEEMQFVLNSRTTFKTFEKIYKFDGLTDIQKATMYLYIIKASYGANTKHFGAKNRDLSDLNYLERIKERLSKVIIENKSFDSVIKQYDSINTLFYCDPPYYETEKYYNMGNFVFNEQEHLKLKDILSKIKGKFILSYNNDGFIKNLYKEFNIEEIERHNNLTSRYKDKSKNYRELIIKNY